MLPERTLHALGALMSASQDSCRALFECSCAELDALTALAVRAGAYGSRLTGAGWGGCTVSLVAADAVGAFVRALREGYAPYRGLSEEQWREAVFATVPSNGAFGASRGFLSWVRRTLNRVCSIQAGVRWERTL